MSHKSPTTKIILYPSDGKAKVWGKKGPAHDPKHRFNFHAYTTVATTVHQWCNVTE